MGAQDMLSADDGGLLIGPVEYVCRVCTDETTVYAAVEEVDGQPAIDLSGARLESRYCETCAQQRTMVARPALEAGEADESAGA